jgi:hypothetical protein
MSRIPDRRPRAGAAVPLDGTGPAVGWRGFQRYRPSNESEHLGVCVTDESGNEVFRTKAVNLQHPTTADEILSAARFKAS